MEKLGFFLALILLCIKFILITVAWGILIAVGFEIGKRLIVRYDARVALKKTTAGEQKAVF